MGLAWLFCKQCKSCDAGYHPVNKLCVAWNGNCVNGSPLAQAARTKDAQCTSCKKGQAVPDELRADACNPIHWLMLYAGCCACHGGPGEPDSQGICTPHCVTHRLCPFAPPHLPGTKKSAMPASRALAASASAWSASSRFAMINRPAHWIQVIRRRAPAPTRRV